MPADTAGQTLHEGGTRARPVLVPSRGRTPLPVAGTAAQYGGSKVDA